MLGDYLRKMIIKRKIKKAAEVGAKIALTAAATMAAQNLLKLAKEK